MKYSELIKEMSLRLHIPQTEVRRILKHTTNAMGTLLDGNISFFLPAFGLFTTHIRQKHRSFNPNIRKYVILPKKRVVQFKPSSVLKDSVNPGSDA